MRAFGLTSDDVVVRVSDRRLLQALPASRSACPTDAIAGVYGVIDKLERTAARRLGGEARGARRARRRDRAHRSTIADVDASTSSRRARHDAAAPAVAGVRALSSRYVPALLGGRRIWLQLDLSIVRGLAYYTGIVFELFDRVGRVPRDLRRRTLRQAARSRSAAPTCRRSASAWATWCSASCCARKGLMRRGADSRADFWVAARRTTFAARARSCARRRAVCARDRAHVGGVRASRRADRCQQAEEGRAGERREGPFVDTLRTTSTNG